MSITDRGLGIQLLTLRDLLDEDVSDKALDGATVQPSSFRARVFRFEDSGRIKDVPICGLSPIKYWIILDCGEKDERQKPRWAITGNWTPDSLFRKDRYIPVGVGVDQEIRDVEHEENGKAIPGTYLSWDEACEISSDLCSVCRIHEE